MTRPSDITRDRILKAAERLFAEHGFHGTSIRAIVNKARVNQAAINYPFHSKDGLYREVLRAAFRGMTADQISHAEEMKSMSAKEALGAFLRRQLHPLRARDEYSRHMRIFNWETVRPTPIFGTLMAEDAPSFMGLTADLVRHFLPQADRRTLTVASIWLLSQCSMFLRNRDQLAQPPIGLQLEDDAVIEWMAKTISHWVVAGLGNEPDQAPKMERYG
jgi:AcrR family transcriptional regulator